jgi:pantoate kinase
VYYEVPGPGPNSLGEAAYKYSTVRAPRGVVAEPSPRRGRAFAPAHVTGFFAPRLEALDPRARGSIGGGLVLDVGVRAEAEWRAGPPAPPLLLGRPAPQLAISRDVAERLLARRPGRLTVRLSQDLPTGQGFGSSSAGATATALAVGGALGLSKRTAIEVAHLADLFGRGGLGGVAAILGGGLELRLRAGLPPWGRVARWRFPGPLFVGSVGPPLRSPRILRDPRASERFALGGRLLAEAARDPGPETFWRASESFTEAVGLASPPLQQLLRGLRRRRAHAAQAMFGNSFFAAPIRTGDARALASWLQPRSTILGVVEVARQGARRLGSHDS